MEKVVLVDVLVIQLDSALHRRHSFIFHDEVERIRNDCDQKVKHKDDDEEDLHHPNDPDARDVELWDLFITSFVPPSPIVVGWRLEVTYGWSENGYHLDEKLGYEWIVIMIWVVVISEITSIIKHGS